MIDTPGKLIPYHRKIINRRKYKKIVRNCMNGSIKWSDKSLAELKNNIRVCIRAQQNGRCFFCKRRIIMERRNAYEAIEHYLDKSKQNYKKFVFNPFNLTICCHGCNLQKSTRDLGPDLNWSHVYRPPPDGKYRWLHPYFDEYFDNIEILPGPIYKVKRDAPKKAQAQQMIDDLNLSNLRELERRNFKFDELAARLNKVAYKCINGGRRVALGLKILDIQRGLLNNKLL